MISVVNFCLSRLKQDELFSFLSDVLTNIWDIMPVIPGFMRDFEDAVNTFKLTLTPQEIYGISEDDLTHANRGAGKAWSSFDLYLRAMMNYPEDNVRNAVQICRDVFNSHQNPNQIPLNKAYTSLSMLVDALLSIPEETRAQAMINIWIDDLKLRIARVQKLFLHSSNDNACADESLGAARFAVENAYSAMISELNAKLSQSPSAQFVQLANALNTLISNKQARPRKRIHRINNQQSCESEGA